MRVSLTARFVSHPPIDFRRPRVAPGRARLGLTTGVTVYHRPRRLRRTVATVAALRSQTSRFSFPVLGRLPHGPIRRQASPLGLPRAQRG